MTDAKLLMTDQPPCSEVMILADWQLFDCIERGHIRIDPYDKNLVQPNTLDIWLGNHFVWHTPSDQVIDPHDRETIASGVEERETDEFVIRPGAFVLARTLECIGLPDNIVAAIEGKSSTYGWASPFTRPEAGSMPE